MKTFRKALLIVNPTSGQGRGKRSSARVCRDLEELGTRCTLRFTEQAGDATAWAAEAGETDIDLVVVMGGDGTLQEIVAGQARSSRKVPIAFIPVGTANVVAMALSLPWQIAPAVETIVAARVHDFDVGYVAEANRHFILMAAVGYPARIVADSPRQRKKVLGIFAYVWAGITNLFRPRHARLLITADNVDNRYVAHTVLVANIGAIGDLHLKVSPDTSPHDGHFDLSVISSRTFWDLVKVLVRMITWRRPATRRLRHLRARKLRIEANPPLPVQIDGESLGVTPFEATVLPGAVQLIVGSRYNRRAEQSAEAAARAKA